VVATPEFEVDRCSFALAIRRWFPKTYIKQYAMAIFEGGMLIEITFPWTSSPFAILLTIAMGNKFSKGGNFVRAFGRLTSYYVPFV
jgi:hypothetical protein